MFKRKWQRRGIVEDNESKGEEDDFGSDLSPDVKRSKTPYRRLAMHEPFIPPRKKSAPLVRASDEGSEDDPDSRSRNS
jgi:hypothetical protein